MYTKGYTPDKKTWRGTEQERKNAGKRARHAAIKDQLNAQLRAKRKSDPRAAKNAELKRHYGITLAEYEGLLAVQGGRCKACGDGPGQRPLAVDHCHESGLIRGLLCGPCNSALGLLRECPRRMDALKTYISNWNWLK